MAPVIKLPPGALPLPARRPAFTAQNTRAFTISGVRVRVFTSQRVLYRQPNPKHRGCAAWKRYEKYMTARTIEEALSLGSAEGDLLFDLKVGFLAFPQLRCSLYEKLPSYSRDEQEMRSELLATTETRASMVSTSLCRQRQKHKAKLTERWQRKQRELGGQCEPLSKRRRTDQGTEAAGAEVRGEAAQRSPHECDGISADGDYQVVVLSYPHDLRIDTLRTNTLAVLEQQGVPKKWINIVVASDTEKAKYSASLGPDCPNILVAQRGVVRARTWIVKHFGEGVHVVSLDDDVEGISWRPPGSAEGTSVPLPAGGFDGIVRHAASLMRQQQAYVWALSVSSKLFNLYDSISRRNGLLSGNFYGFLNRPSLATKLLPKLGQAAEDCERSVRYFAEDGVVLRYMMYHAVTQPYVNSGGLQTIFPSRLHRKKAEIAHVEKLQKEFPSLVSLTAKKTLKTVNIVFHSMGMNPLKPDTSGDWS